MPETMTPRERVAAALNHKEPDRVPISLGGSANHLTEQRYVLLRDHFGVQDIPRRRCWLGFTPRLITIQSSTNLAPIFALFIFVHLATLSPIR